MSEVEKKDEDKKENDENKYKKKTFPDQLNITILTSVPGFQRIDYKPSMTIKDTQDRTVRINPMIKLRKAVVDRVPKEYRVKQFFNPGLFQSLINFNGMHPLSNLIQATRHGYVDNNIRVTLDAIFPVGSVIYLGGKPYAIGDVQWTTGDWGIELKQKRVEIDPNRVSDPYLYMKLVNEDIISGEQQLRELPRAVLSGNNYSGPPIVVPPAPKPEEKKPEEKKPEEKKPEEKKPEEKKVETSTALVPAKPQSTALVPVQKQPQSTALVPAKPQSTALVPAKPPSTALVPAKPQEPQPALKQIEGPPALKQIEGPPAPNQIEQPKAPPVEQPKAPPVEQPKVEEVSPERGLYSQEQMSVVLKGEKILNKEGKIVDNPKYGVNKGETRDFQKYFYATSGDGAKYWSLINDTITELKHILQSSLEQQTANASNIQQQLNDVNDNIDRYFAEVLQPSTVKTRSENVRGFSPAGYEQLCKQSYVLNTYSNGDCFFDAVSKGINIYNYENPDNRITYNVWGTLSPFTITSLRDIVYDYLVSGEKSKNKDRPNIEVYLKLSQVDADNLNDLFNAKLSSHPDKDNIDQYYPQILNDIYKLNPNFLVYKPREIPSKDTNAYISPFRPLIPSEINDYIMSSDYWGEMNAVSAMCEILNINVITVERYEPREGVSRLRVLPAGNDFINQNCSQKIIFLYNNGQHYELLDFIYYTRPTEIVNPKTHVIIKQNDPVNYPLFIKGKISTLPPIYLLFLIYGSLYVKLESDTQKNFPLYLDFMTNFDIGVQSILNRQSTSLKDMKERANFIKKFDDIFPDTSSIENKKKRPMLGGQQPQQQYYYQQVNPGPDQETVPVQNLYYRPYISPPQPQNFLKSPDASKIAYKITIHMELFPGTSLTPKQISQAKCNNRYYAIRKALSDFTGIPYTIRPVYNQNQDPTQTRKIPQTAGRRKTRKRI